MSSATLTAVGEYLATSYRPDREIVDGQLLERNVGEYDHSNLQTALATWLRNRQREWNIRALVEQRVRVSASRYRVPDVIVISRDLPVEPVITRPPLICIEILSKDDTLRSMQDRVDDYRALGAADIWILDPAKRRAYVCTHGDFREPEGDTLVASACPVAIPLPDLFAEME